MNSPRTKSPSEGYTVIPFGPSPLRYKRPPVPKRKLKTPPRSSPNTISGLFDLDEDALNEYKEKLKKEAITKAALERHNERQRLPWYAKKLKTPEFNIFRRKSRPL